MNISDKGYRPETSVIFIILATGIVLVLVFYPIGDSTHFCTTLVMNEETSVVYTSKQIMYVASLCC